MASGGRGPIDPRLWRYARSSRRYLLVHGVFGAIVTAATIVTAVLVAGMLADLIVEPGQRTFGDQSWRLSLLAVAVVVRVGAAYGQQRFADDAAGTVIAELRERALATVTDPRKVSPRRLVEIRDRLATLLTRGLDALAPYLTGFVPALVSVLVTVPAVVVVMLVVDLTSGLIVLGTLPLIPIFMVLIGRLTSSRTRDRLDAMDRQSAQLLDLIAGLPTLRALGRQREPAPRVRALGEAHRRSTMSALRIAFLSGAVLELLATLSVALVAVSIGLRLVFGEMSLYAGVLCLVLAPEAYLPLRAVGSRFHESEAGTEAAREVLDVIDEGVAAPTGGLVPNPQAPISIRDVGLCGRDGWAPRGLTATIAPGTLTVIAGPNGSGKSSLLLVLLGALEPDEGAVEIGGVGMPDVDRDAWWRRVGWLPQQATDPADRLSAGQRQRAALDRVLSVPDADVLMLDEPAAHMDRTIAAGVLTELRERADRGDTVIVVSHDRDWIAAADRVIALESDAPIGAADV
ncbi:ABC transporter ATP-binding protein/permease [Jongsikchunia kroppenstedtii]|uniref:ABC transporter ATP-binding protein/permease n=1 Tax=Jongsikchunia kroppenstedtii TaxID=1121721 RepID=UPI00036C34B9|nr:ABC transporter transmembrane domain-containing protein [Jongsikchunia kroppenstedtii]